MVTLPDVERTSIHFDGLNDRRDQNVRIRIAVAMRVGGKIIGIKEVSNLKVLRNRLSMITGDSRRKILRRFDAAGGCFDRQAGNRDRRPGAPISIPGLPIETASGGIKAPQYFAPGVAGDHGEPIAQYFQIGNFLYPNNLPANAHGNGYSDPNILIPP